jgi:hypothetical protein
MYDSANWPAAGGSAPGLDPCATPTIPTDTKPATSTNVVLRTADSTQNAAYQKKPHVPFGRRARTVLAGQRQHQPARRRIIIIDNTRRCRQFGGISARRNSAARVRNVLARVIDMIIGTPDQQCT